MGVDVYNNVNAVQLKNKSQGDLAFLFYTI